MDGQKTSIKYNHLGGYKMPMRRTMIINPGEPITLKEFKKMIKDIGYRYKTEVFGRHRHLEVLDKNKKFVIGSGANVYSENTYIKHKPAFELLKKYRGRVFDEEGDKVIF